jgi:hypothetical protein
MPNHPPEFNDFDPNNPFTALALVSERVANLGKEKEALEKELEKERIARDALDVRVAKMEAAFQRGAGMLMLIPILGTALGLILAYGKIIFAPWTKQ